MGFFFFTSIFIEITIQCHFYAYLIYAVIESSCVTRQRFENIIMVSRFRIWDIDIAYNYFRHLDDMIADIDITFWWDGAM